MLHPRLEAPPPPPPRLLDQLRAQVRYRHFSIRTEHAYVYWARDFIRFHGLRHPAEMGQAEVEAFLTSLAVERKVAPATHKQALAALLFLYQKVLGQAVSWMNALERPKTQPRLPAVLTHDEVSTLLATIEPGAHRLLAQLLYGTGMRLMEGLRLRIKDIDFDRRAIIVREGKGAKDRVVMLPAALESPLRAQIDLARALWQADRDAGAPGVHLPHALARKYPRAPLAFSWFWLFPQAQLALDPREPGVPGAPPPSAGRRLPAPVPQGRGRRPYRQAGLAAHAAPLLRHAPAAGGLRHPHRAGTARPRRCQHDDDLHPRAALGWGRGAKPAGRAARHLAG